VDKESRYYKNEVQPKLIKATLSQIAAAIDVSILYASEHPKGQTPIAPEALGTTSKLAWAKCTKL